MGYPLINGAAINSNAQDGGGSTKGILMAVSSAAIMVRTEYVQGNDALTIGTPKAGTGVDVTLAPWGIAMAVAGMSQAVLEQPPASVDVLVKGQRAMRIGAPAVISSFAVEVIGADALRMGQPSCGCAVRAAGAGALALGSPSSVVVVQAVGQDAMTLGLARTELALSALPGIAMSKAGRSTAIQGAVICEASEGGSALVFGAIRPIGHIVRARQSLVLELGRPSVTRNHQC